MEFITPAQEAAWAGDLPAFVKYLTDEDVFGHRMCEDRMVAWRGERREAELWSVAKRLTQEHVAAFESAKKAYYAGLR